MIKRSFQFSIFLVAITAGIAQAVPEIKGITLFPLKPNLRKPRSIKKTTLLIYPVSSKIEINRNRKAICGINITIPPNPGIIPSVNRLVKTPCGNLFFKVSLKFAKVESIKSIGILLQSKMD